MFKMCVFGQRFEQSESMHDSKAQTIGKRPFLVSTLEETGLNVVEAIDIGPFDAASAGLVDRLEMNLQQVNLSPRCEQGRRLVKHIIDRQKALLPSPSDVRESLRRKMFDIRADEHGEKTACVHEDFTTHVRFRPSVDW
jgi:hypothetical protein